MNPRKEVIIRDVATVKHEPSACGRILPLSSADDFKEVNLAIAEINTPTIPHFHKERTEFYFVLDGEGKLIAGLKTSHKIKKGVLVIIPPNTVHYTIPRIPLKVMTISTPAWTKEDEHIIHNISEIEWIKLDYSDFREKYELISEFLSREGIDFKEGISKEEEEMLDIERQSLVLRIGLNKMSIAELRKFMSLAH